MTIKNPILIVLLLLLTGSVKAQLSMTLQVPPSGVVQKSQLWNIVLVNGSNTTYEVEVNITISSTADNNPVLTASSRSVAVPKGASQLKYSDFSPVTYKYLSAAFNGDMRPEGFIPVGNYTVCYTVGHWRGDAYEPLTEDCINLEVQPLSPPVLNTPFDKDTVSTPYPQFTWLPPAPLSLFSNLTYDMMVTAILPNQSALQAIQQNMPVYSTGNITAITSLYPAAAHALDTAQWYAWAVVARNNNQVVAQSEVWSFYSRGQQQLETAIVSNSLLSLRKEQEATGLTEISEHKLGIRYYSYDPAHETSIRFVAPDGKVVKEVKQQVNYGENFWWFELNSAFEKNTAYQVQLTDAQRNRYNASFSIR